ncbi:alpha/beta hydrolase fold domain-containing protein [Novosphingobium malaysiense]|uniref:alpha/beta hydrolase fold domain-containing protein n=1 Tax=Novosphingobium malaysiense TaxID=1348853 RepID=UPI001E45D87D|nr:alpha/beta hydrolase fold domain-containing protein [Novosphingobium malaysiense]
MRNDRAKGPGLPPKGALKKIRFTDGKRAGLRTFGATPITGITSPIKMLYLHGGAFVLDFQSIQWGLVTGLLQRVPGEIIAPLYPLGPEANWSETMDAVHASYMDLIAQYDPAQVVVCGDSAGGGLSLLLAQRLRDEGLPLPAALVMFSPCLDISACGADQPAIEKRDPVLRLSMMKDVARMWVQDVPADDPRVSALFGDQSGLPPSLVFSGDREILDSDALRLAAKNPEVVHRHYPEMQHVWPVSPLKEGKQALDEAAAFMLHYASG